MEHFIELLKHGYNFSQAAERLGYTYKWWSITSKNEEEWAQQARDIVAGVPVQWEVPDLSQMSFANFVELYAGFELADHQKKIEAALMDPLAKIVLILGHPESGKSTLVSLWYVLYNLARKLDSRTALVTKNSTKAQDLLTRIKRYLTEEQLYDESPRNLIEDFNGWKPIHGDLEWSQEQIFTRHRKSGERDASVQALGLSKLIYGSRLDYLILDDALVQDNQLSEVTRDRIDNWFDSEARSRAQRGQTIVNGTRLIPQDLYGQWKKVWADNRLFRGVYIPAILEEYTENERPSWPEYWTLDGYDLHTEVDGVQHVTGYQMGLRDIRESIVSKNADRWRLVYQQEDVEVGSNIFTPAHIETALELGAHRKLGQVFPHERLILGVDPATTGRAAAILLAVDPITQIRTVVDIFVGSGLGASGVRHDLLYDFWDRYRQAGHTIGSTVVETNFVKTLLGDESLMARARAAGTNVIDHHTSGRGKRGKWDEEYGIATLAPLLGGGLLAFANAGVDDKARLQPLFDDMLVFPWSNIQDTLIALWVASLEAANAAVSILDQSKVAKRRGVPPSVQRRRR
jgi:hypothetical protein